MKLPAEETATSASPGHTWGDDVAAPVNVLPNITADSETKFDDEDLVSQCIEIIRSEQKASVSLLQRRLKLGYTRAARMMDELERRGIVGPAKGAEPRDLINIPPLTAQDTAAKSSKPAKPKKDKPVKITKSAAAALKETLEKRSLGDKTPVAMKLGKNGKLSKADKKKVEAAARKILKPKEEQRDLVNEGKLVVPTSPLYVAGKRLKDCCIQEKLNDDEKAEAIADVLKCMRKAKRYNYNVEGYGFELDHQGAKDKVRIIKPK